MLLNRQHIALKSTRTLGAIISLITLLLIFQWSSTHIHLPTSHHHDGDSHSHSTLIHQHSVDNHHPDAIDVASPHGVTTHAMAVHGVVDLDAPCTQAQHSAFKQLVCLPLLTSIVVHTRYIALPVWQDEAAQAYQSFLTYHPLGLRAPPVLS